MVRTNQGGSILSFAVLGGVMALLLIGGAYIVRHNLAPAERDPRVATSEQQDESSEQNQDDEPAPANNNSQQQDTPTPQQNAAPGNTSNDNTSEESAQTLQPTPAAGDQSSGGLPSTGPSSAFFGGLMISGLVGASAAYMQSRRHRASL